MADQDISKDQQLKLVMERVRKILAMTESPHEEEAKTASEMAHKILKEYNLTLSDLEVEKEGIIEEQYDENFNRIAPWKLTLLIQIMRTNYCESYQSIIGFKNNGGYRNDMVKKFIVVGREANVTTAKIMADYLVNVVERMAKNYGGDNDEKKSYKSGLSLGLRVRLKKMIEQEKVESPISTALVKRENALVENYMNQKNNMTKTTIKTNIKDAMAYIAGQKDASKINLNSQLDDGKKFVAAGYIG